MSNLKITVFTFFLLFTNSLLFSQIKLTGTIKDTNNNVIQNAIIGLQKTNQSTNSNEKGMFSLNIAPHKNYTISISCLGYTPMYQNITTQEENMSLSFVLEEITLQLQNIVVTGTFNHRSLLESGTSISTLDTKKIQQAYPQGTAGLLQETTGTFTDASAGEVFTKVYTRGVSASAEDDLGWYYVSLQEDGLPVSLVQYSYYSPDLFHRVDLTTQKLEALRGGSAVVTALNGPGGIYNFISHGVKDKFGGDIQLTGGAQGNNNALFKIDTNIGGPLGDNWFFNFGGHFRHDDGARDNNFTFSKGGQLKFNVIKENQKGYFKFYGKILNDKTNRYTGVAAINWNNPTPAFGQNFNTTSLLLPDFTASIPDGRSLETNNNFNPTQGVHAKDFSLGFDFLQDLENDWSIRNHLKFSTKNANWQTSISNAFVSLNGFTPYFLIRGANIPIGEIVFKDIQSGDELARLNNSGLLTGNSIEYLNNNRLPNDAILGTSAWYKENLADEWVNQLTVRKKTKNHDISTGIALGFSDVSSFTQASFAFATYEPNPRTLQVTLENPGEEVVALSDENGISNYGGLFFVNAEAKVYQISSFINDYWKISDKIHLDLGIRTESITHQGNKDRFAPISQNGGLDGDENTAYDASILTPTGEKDFFNYTYNYLSFSGGINYKIDKSSVIFSRISQGNKAPELNYYFDNFSNVPINRRGEVQKITQVEIGVKHSAKNFSFTSTAFWSRLKDIGIANFEFDDANNSIFYTPTQFNTSTTLGLELESTYSPFSNFTCRLNGVIQNPKATKWQIYDAAGTVDTNDDVIVDYSGNTLPFNPSYLFNFSNEYEKGKIAAFLKWQFNGKRFGNVANGFTLPSYSIFNLGAGYKINKNISANVLVTNLFNSEGLANFFGANNFGANANGATPEFIANNPDASFIVVPVLGRRASLKLNYTF